MTQEYFNYLAPAVRDWITELGWGAEDIDTFSATRGIVPAADVVDSHGHPVMPGYAPSSLIEVTVSKGNEARTEIFCDSSGQWKKVEKAQ